MKMQLRLLRDPVGIENIEAFSFAIANNSIPNRFNLVKAFAEVDLDPLLEEQTIRIDLGSAAPTMNYAMAIYNNPAKQEMDKYPLFWFFYVTKVVRKNSSTVCEITLKLDGLTTLMESVKTIESKKISDLFTAQSYIRREHRSRFLAPSSTNYSQYAIDKVKEGIPVDLKKIAKRTLLSNSLYEESMQWWLIYRSRQSWSGGDPSSGNAIDVYICPEKRLKVSSSQSSGTGQNVVWQTIEQCQFSSGGYYEVDSERSPGFNFSIGSFSASAATYFMIIVHYTLVGGVMTFEIFAYKGSKGAITESTKTTVSFSSFPTIYASFVRLSTFKALSSLTTDSEEIDQAPELQINAGTTTVSAVYSTKFSDLDRTDPLLVKIVETPYPPAILTRDANYNFDLANCDFDPATAMWKPRSATPWYQTLTQDGATAIPLTKATAKYIGAAAYNDVWDGFDPKLLSSEFYEIKVVYDVYAASIELENEEIPAARYDDIAGRKLSVYWHISPDMNSLFAIEAKLVYLADASLASKTQDFGSFAVVDRNNEKPIFTNAYLNYMRVGYNYDQKAKSLQNWSSMAGIAISAAGMIAGAAIPGGQALSVASAAGLIASISGAAFGAASRENAMQGKLAQLKAQGTSVSGSSDVAILNLYSKKAQIIEYFPDDAIANSLAILFHRFGYATNQFKKPDVESRSLWNYLEGDVVIDESVTYGVPPQVIDRAIAQIKEGITIMHCKHGVYDLRQTLENWEEDVLQ